MSDYSNLVSIVIEPLGRLLKLQLYASQTELKLNIQFLISL